MPQQACVVNYGSWCSTDANMSSRVAPRGTAHEVGFGARLGALLLQARDLALLAVQLVRQRVARQQRLLPLPQRSARACLCLCWAS